MLKGTGNKDDGYSAFEATRDDLKQYLKNKGVYELYVACLTTDYCVKNTVLDAVKFFETIVVEDGIRAVDVNPGDGEKAIEELKKAGAIFTNSGKIQ